MTNSNGADRWSQGAGGRGNSGRGANVHGEELEALGVKCGVATAAEGAAGHQKVAERAGV